MMGFDYDYDYEHEQEHEGKIDIFRLHFRYPRLKMFARQPRG